MGRNPTERSFSLYKVILKNQIHFDIFAPRIYRTMLDKFPLKTVASARGLHFIELGLKLLNAGNRYFSSPSKVVVDFCSMKLNF